MWKPNTAGPGTPSSLEPTRPTPTPTPSSSSSSFETSAPRPLPQTTPVVGEQSMIGKSLMVKGEITGSESLFVDGRVEGMINLPGNRVTVGRNGQVAASVSAREIVVLGKIRGNCHATDRVDIRAEGSLTGDVIAARISIEDGAFFKGGIDIRKPSAEPKDGVKPTESAPNTPTQSLLGEPVLEEKA